MNKQEKLKLAKKYFIEQKIDEIITCIKYILVAICIGGITYFLFKYLINPIALWVGKYVCTNTNICKGNGFDFLSNGYLILAFILGVSTLIIIFSTIWLSSNWKKAKRRAELE